MFFIAKSDILIKKMRNKLTHQIAKEGSKTFFNSSLFFPREVREEVFILYSFVRTADDFVDSIPQKKKEFYDFVNSFNKGLKGSLNKKNVDNDG